MTRLLTMSQFKGSREVWSAWNDDFNQQPLLHTPQDLAGLPSSISNVSPVHVQEQATLAGLMSVLLLPCFHLRFLVLALSSDVCLVQIACLQECRQRNVGDHEC